MLRMLLFGYASKLYHSTESKAFFVFPGLLILLIYVKL
jgi:hypothetical protein